MFRSRRILAVIPARGGSKGVPLKNIRPLLGRPLIAHAAPLIAAVHCIDRAAVSTDNDRIAEVARSCGLEVPFRRPASLGEDTVGDVPVLQHALQEMERLDGVTYDVVVMLQPTCPLRTPAHVHEVIRTLVEGEWDAVWTVSRTDPKYHPLKQLRLVASELQYYDAAGAAITARQQLEPLYYRNGSAYAITRECLMHQQKLLGSRSTAVVVQDLLVNIDTLDDFEAAERALLARAAST
jgi:CMP-N-acetylneuraminic acid synthetase